MPSLLNGFGTWYYGKENVHLEWGTCQYCHNITTLVSYDTQRYLVGLYVPLIPFGRYRILRECPACTKHKAAKLKNWESAKAEAREKALAMVRNPPDTREAVDEAVGGVIAFHDVDTWNEVVPYLVEHYPNDPDMASLIGSGYHFFNHLEEAANALRASLEAKEDADTRRELGLVLIRLRRAVEAHEVLRPLLVARHPENLQHWYLLAAAYQAEGEHRTALDLVNEANRQYPETASDKAWKELKKTSEKHLDSGKAIVPKILKTDTQHVRETSAPIARFAGPAVLLALLIVFAVWSYNTSQHHQLFLVNGLERPYNVQWDGQTHKLTRNGVLPLDAAEGEHTVAAADIGLEAQTISIEANAFTRPFTKPVFVVNPDQVAPIIRESMEYIDVRVSGRDGEYESELYVGLFHKLKRVNYPFQPFPETVMVEEGGSSTKTRIGVARDWSPSDVYMALANTGKTDEAHDYVLGRFEHQPDDLETLELFEAVLSEDEYVEALRGKLAVRPVLVDLHRYYQEASERLSPDHDLVAEYTDYLSAEPKDASLKYLLARAHPLPDEEAIRLYREACEAEPPCPHAHHALAMFHLSEGRAAEALELANRACELRPGTSDFKASRRLALIATGSWDALLKDVERNAQGTAASMSNLVVETVALASMGKPMPEIEQQVKRTCAAWRREGLDDESAKMVSSIVKAEAAYVQGDLESYIKYASICGEWYDFSCSVTAEDLEKTVAAVEGLADPSVSEFLLCYLLAHAKDNSARADDFMEIVMAVSREGSQCERHVAACFSGEKACVAEEIPVLGEAPNDAAIMLTALGIRFPEHREALFARARKLNFNPQFPHRFLAGILGPAPDTSAAEERVENQIQNPDAASVPL